MGSTPEPGPPVDQRREAVRESVSLGFVETYERRALGKVALDTCCCGDAPPDLAKGSPVTSLLHSDATMNQIVDHTIYDLLNPN